MTIANIANTDGDKLKIIGTGYPAVSIENLEFFDTVDGTAINTNLWNQSVSTMTITQASGFINLNPTNSTTANAYAIAATIQTFFVTSCLPLHFHFDLQSSFWNVPINTVQEMGWGTCATNATPTDGVFIRALNGSIYLVANNNSVETSVAFSLPDANTTREFVLDVYSDYARLYLNKVLVAQVNMPVTQPALTNSNRQPFFCRVYNKATVPTSSPTMKLGQVSIQQRNANLGKPFADKMIGIGRSTIQNPVTTFTQLANYANSAAPASATLANATAGYATLGGQWQFAAVAGAETDYALFAYQVPAGYQLYVSDIRIASINTGAVNSAITPTLLQWGVGLNSSAVDLATADGAGTWQPRRLALGNQSFGLSAVIGAVANDITWSPQMPLCVDGGRYFHVILKIPVGTNTVSQVIRGTLAIHGYFE